MLDLLIKPGLPVPGVTAMAPLAVYTHRDGVTRRVPWSVRTRGPRCVPAAR
ncbi:hypothetical protein ACFQYP_44145 [Nonomuraea antimicrobica]